MSASEEQRRRELLGGLALAGRSWRATAVAFHLVLAEQQGVSATEEKALDILERDGPLTAGELGQHIGLAPASVTGLVDRLERKGLARRVKSSRDGRQVLLEVNAEKAEEKAALLGELQGEMERLYAGYSAKQLETIYHFLTEAARIQRASTERLAGLNFVKTL